MIDIAIVSVYLVAMLSVGWVAGRRVKTMREFAISNRTFSVTTLVTTNFATFICGDDLMGATQRIFSMGIFFLIVQWSEFVHFVIHACIITPKVFKDFADKISIGEIMAELYGKTGQLICGIAATLYSLGIITLQINAIGYVYALFLGIPHIYGCIIGSSTIIAYSVFGGIRSIVFTDILQFFVLIVGVPLMASVALNKVGGFECLMCCLPPKYLHVDTSNKEFFAHTLYIFLFAFPIFNPLLIQRSLIAESSMQAIKSFIITAILYIPFYLVIAIIALCTVVLFPNGDSDTVFINMFNHSLPPVVKGMAISGVLAVLMSTTDNFINISVIAIARDIVANIIPSKLNDHRELILSRTLIIILGLLSIFVGTYSKSLIDFILFSVNFWTPAVTAPMMLYMFNIRTRIKIYVVSTLMGLSSIIIYRYYMPKYMFLISHLFGMSITMISMLILHKIDLMLGARNNVVKR